MIQLKADDQFKDLHLWKWLESVLEHLETDGMSSDDEMTIYCLLNSNHRLTGPIPGRASPAV